MRLAPRPFGSRSVVRLGVICPELRPPLVAIPPMRDMAHGWPLTRLLSAVAFVTRTPTVRVARRRAVVTVAVE